MSRFGVSKPMNESFHIPGPGVTPHKNRKISIPVRVAIARQTKKSTRLPGALQFLSRMGRSIPGRGLEAPRPCGHWSLTSVCAFLCSTSGALCGAGAMSSGFLSSGLDTVVSDSYRLDQFPGGRSNSIDVLSICPPSSVGPFSPEVLVTYAGNRKGQHPVGTGLFYAWKRTRTSTTLRSLVPETSVSTNFTIQAEDEVENTGRDGFCQ